MVCEHCTNDDERLMELVSPRVVHCSVCSKDFTIPARRLTRTERHQELADSGCDTWEEYRGER